MLPSAVSTAWASQDTDAKDYLRVSSLLFSVPVLHVAPARFCAGRLLILG